MLVGALIGMEALRDVYRHAIDARYRFYSYGDASLLWKAPTS
jgi:S-adenosylmethionine:tRNA ribosyltransferase-isomerase